MGVFKILLFFGPLLIFLLWQYLSVSRTLERDDDSQPEADTGR